MAVSGVNEDETLSGVDEMGAGLLIPYIVEISEDAEWLQPKFLRMGEVFRKTCWIAALTGFEGADVRHDSFLIHNKILLMSPTIELINKRNKQIK